MGTVEILLTRTMLQLTLFICTVNFVMMKNFIIEIETESVEGGEYEHGLDYEDADDTQIKQEEEEAGDMQLEQLQGVSILGSSFLKPFEESKVQPINQIEKSTKNQAQPKKKIKEN